MGGRSWCASTQKNKRDKEEEGEKNDAPTRERFSSDSWTTSLRIDIDDSVGLGSIRRIEFVDFPYIDSRYVVRLRFMNRNSFSINGVYIGIKNPGDSHSCPSTSAGYKFVLRCSGVIRAKSSGTAQCDKYKGNFCVVGFWTSEEFTYRDEVEAFRKKHLSN